MGISIAIIIYSGWIVEIKERDICLIIGGINERIVPMRRAHIIRMNNLFLINPSTTKRANMRNIRATSGEKARVITNSVIIKRPKTRNHQLSPSLYRTKMKPT